MKSSGEVMRRRWIGSALLPALLCGGCSTGNTYVDGGRDVVCGMLSKALCNMIDDRYSTTVAEGMLVDSPYSIKKDPAGRFLLTSSSLKSPIGLAKPKSLTKLQTFRTRSATFDLYQAPMDDCPQRYMAVIASGNTVRTSAFGCMDALQFASVQASNAIYATQAAGSDGTTPWAYRITTQGAGQPQTLTAYREHPDYAFWNDQEQGARKQARSSQTQQASSSSSRAKPVKSERSASVDKPSSTARSQPVASTPRVSRALPSPETPVLPGEVDEGSVVYEKPNVRL